MACLIDERLRLALDPATLKAIVAVADQRIDTDKSVHINGKSLVNSGLVARDELGRKLSSFPSGVIPPGEIFLHSDFIGSFDPLFSDLFPQTVCSGWRRRF